MKTSNNKKTLLLSTIAGASVVLGAAAIALSNTSSTSNVSTLNNVNNNQLTNANSRNITDNTTDKSRLTNPDELIFMSEQLTPESAPVFEGGSINETNLTKWKNLSENVKKLVGSSPIKDELAGLYTQIEGSANLNKALAELDKWKEQNPSFVTDAILQAAKDAVIAESQFKVNISDITGINDIPTKLLELSGIAEGNKIASISNPNAFKSTDLIKDSANASTNLDIQNVAGTGYKQLVKIAEIDANTAGNYAIQFNYKKSASTITANGVLYIRNDNNQIASAANAEELTKNLDVFGRYTMANGAEFDKHSYDKNLKNFVLQKTDTGLEVFVRVNESETISNVKFATVNDIEGATNLVAPSKFGILDVQAEENATFRSKILGGNEKTKLIDNIDDKTKVISSVEFFSDTLTSNHVSGQNEWENNRTLEFYQLGKDTEILLPLYYANNAVSDVTSKTFTYNQLNIFTNGSDTGQQQSISIKSSDDNVSTIDPETYDMFSELKDQLPDVVKQQENFEKASTITLHSAFDTESKVTKQTLKFSDYFYAVGRRDGYGWTSVSRTGKTEGITIIDPTQKIFLEKPSIFKGTQVLNKESTLKAQEQINERTAVLGFMGRIYGEFAKSNSGEFANENYDLGDVTLWVANADKNTRSKYSNITTKVERISGKGNDIYQKINSNWTVLSEIINSLFGTQVNGNRYQVGTGNSAVDIVTNFYANQTEFTQGNYVDTKVTEAIDLVKKEMGTITQSTTYESLSDSVKKQLSQILIDLIGYQFQTINNEFVSRQYDPIYSKLKDAITDETQNQYTVLKPINDFLEVYTTASGMSLIKYKDNAWGKVSEAKTTTLKEAMTSLFNLLYFSNSSTSNQNEVSELIGNSLFNSSTLSVFQSLSAESLTTFESDSVESKQNKVTIYNEILRNLGSSSFDFQDAINEMLRTGNPLNLKFDINNAIRQTISNISSDTPTRVGKTPNSIEVKSYYLDDLISGTNAIIALKWKLGQILGSTTKNSEYALFASSSTNNNTEVINRINEILAGNPQASVYELSIWSNILKETYDYSNYSMDLSGRNGTQNLEGLINSMIADENILAQRSNDTAPAVVALEKIMKILWWVIVALIGVGVLTASTVGVATKNRQVRLSSRPVLKWLLISGIVLGLAAVVLAIVFGVVL